VKHLTYTEFETANEIIVEELVQLSSSAAMITNMASPLCEPKDATATIFGTSTFDLPLRHERKKERKKNYKKVIVQQ
jgi:hypothetical protein